MFFSRTAFSDILTSVFSPLPIHLVPVPPPRSIAEPSRRVPRGAAALPERLGCSPLASPFTASAPSSSLFPGCPAPAQRRCRSSPTAIRSTSHRLGLAAPPSLRDGCDPVAQPSPRGIGLRRFGHHRQRTTGCLPWWSFPGHSAKMLRLAELQPRNIVAEYRINHCLSRPPQPPTRT